MALFVEVMPREAGDTTSLINFSLIYPFELLETEHLGELVRALFLLNRYVPVGSHGAVRADSGGLLFPCSGRQ